MLTHFCILSGQNKITGRVLEKETEKPVAGAMIMDSTGLIAQSDSTGRFLGFTNDTVLIVLTQGLGRQVFPLKGRDHITVFFELMTYRLDHPLTVHARRPVAPHRMVIDKKELSLNFQRPLANIMNGVPGIYMQSGSLNTNRLTIRGMGNRSPFTTTRVQVYMEDIPLTNGAGETTLEDLDFSIFKSIEVTKGPFDSKYAAGLGGLVSLQFPDLVRQDEGARFDASIGSFGTQQWRQEVQLSGDTSGFLFGQQVVRSDGYRENNQFEKWNITALYRLENEHDRLSVYTFHTDLNAGIPGALNIGDYKNNPSAAAPNWLAARGFEDYRRSRGAVSYKRTWNHQLNTHLSVYGSNFDSYELRPFNIQDVSSYNMGGRASATISRDTGLLRHIEGGMDLFYENFLVHTLENAGNLLSEVRDIRRHKALYLTTGMHFNELKLKMGFRVQDISYQRNLTGNQSDNRQSFGPEIFPHIMAAHPLSASSGLYISLGRGMAQPTLEESLLPDGQLNPEIRAETGWTLEYGIRKESTAGQMQLQLNVYHTRVSDMLVAQRTSEDAFFSINAGSAMLHGVELYAADIIWQWDNTRIGYALSATVTDHQFDEFDTSTGDYSGNDLTGSPSHLIEARLALHSDRWNAIIEGTRVGSYPVTDSNSVYNNAYQVLRAQLDYMIHAEENHTASVGFALENITDTKYASMTSINAGGFNGNAPRYYYPGLPRHFSLRARIGLQ